MGEGTPFPFGGRVGDEGKKIPLLKVQEEVYVYTVLSSSSV
jgi:hypothetical protein